MNKGSAKITLDHPALEQIGRIADREGLDVYVVGGYVRDILLSRQDKDLDILVMGDGVLFARRVAAAMGIPTVVTFERFGTAMVPLREGKVEFVGARKEQYHPGSRKPDVTAGTLEEDLLRRDFTVNAMAVSLNNERYGALLDPLGGMKDLGAGLLRTPLNPIQTFADDPLRIMRAIRLAAQLGFSIEPATLTALSAMREHLKEISQERISDELLKILGTGQPSVGLKLMYESGVMQIVFPELAEMAGVDQRGDHHHKDVLLHTLTVVDNIARTTDNVWLRFVALVHDIAKPRTKAYKEGIGWTFHGHEEIGARMMKKIFQRLRLPMEPLPYVEKLVRFHLRPMVLVDE
ncbi:MAG: cca, partial [Bacteroidetes bacterium]|nr:cca [Bacteroidota bacterium]